MSDNKPCPWPIGDCPHPAVCPCADVAEELARRRFSHMINFVGVVRLPAYAHIKLAKHNQALAEMSRRGGT